MTTPQTDELLDEVQAMLREREREEVRGLDPDDATDGVAGYRRREASWTGRA